MAAEDILKKYGPRVQNAPPRQMGYAEDTARSLGSGAAQFAENAGSGLNTAHDMLSGMIEGGLGYVMEPEAAETWGDRAATAWMPLTALGPERETVQEYIPDAMRHEPQTPAGEIAYRVGRDGPLVMMGGGGTMLNRGLSALGAAAGGYAGEQGAQEFNEAFGIPEEYREYIETGADIAGSIGGSYAPSLVRKGITPNPISRKRERLAQELERRGVPLTAGQKTGNESLHYKEANRSPDAYHKIRDAQGDKFTEGMMKIGNVPQLSDDMATNFNRQHRTLGKQFDALQSVDIVPDGKLAQDLVDIADEYMANTSASTAVRGVQNHISSFKSLFKTHPNGIPGNKVKSVMSAIRSQHQDAVLRGDSTTARTLQRLIDTVDDTVERSLPANMRGQYQKVRADYAKLMLLEDAAGRAGNNVAEQTITPSNLVGASRATSGRKGVARGKGSFTRYGLAGGAFLRDPKNPGTSNTLLANVPVLKDFGNTPTAIGAGLGGLAGGVPGGIIGGMMGAGISRGMDVARMSPMGQKYLANQLARDWDTATGAGRRAIAAGGAASQRTLEDR